MIYTKQEGSTYEPTPRKSIEVYNSSRDFLFMNPLSDEQEKHSGRIVDADDNFENTDLIRLQYTADKFDFFTREFCLKGQKANLSRYFSIEQFQSGIIDIPFVCPIDELDFKIPTKRRESIYVTIFGNSKEKLNTEKTQLPTTEIYIVIENTLSRTKEVDLISLAQGEKPPIGIVVSSNAFKVEGGNDFSMLRVWGSSNQICSVVTFDNELITPSSYFSVNQFQSGIVDIKKDFNIKTNTEVKVNIEGKTKVMYSFK